MKKRQDIVQEGKLTMIKCKLFNFNGKDQLMICKMLVKKSHWPV